MRGILTPVAIAVLILTAFWSIGVFDKVPWIVSVIIALAIGQVSGAIGFYLEKEK